MQGLLIIHNSWQHTGKADVYWPNQLVFVSTVLSLFAVVSFYELEKKFSCQCDQLFRWVLLFQLHQWTCVIVKPWSWALRMWIQFASSASCFGSLALHEQMILVVSIHGRNLVSRVVHLGTTDSLIPSWNAALWFLFSVASAVAFNWTLASFVLLLVLCMICGLKSLWHYVQLNWSSAQGMAERDFYFNLRMSETDALSISATVFFCVLRWGIVTTRIHWPKLS